MSSQELVRQLDERGVAYVIMRGADALNGATTSELRLLVRPGDLVTVETIARCLRLSPAAVPAGSVSAWIMKGEAHGPPLRVTVTHALRYGRRGGHLRTAEPERSILGRRRASAGAAVAAPWDELIDLLLHCLLDLGEIPPEHRVRIARLMALLRSDPPAAGRAAERVERELSPALPWSDLLAGVVLERWNRLLGRRAALERQLLRRAPLATARSAAASVLKRLGNRFRIETRAPALQPLRANNRNWDSG